MMSNPDSRSYSTGPLCKVCDKPMKEHSFFQQKRCAKQARKKGIDLV